MLLISMSINIPKSVRVCVWGGGGHNFGRVAEATILVELQDLNILLIPF